MLYSSGPVSMLDSVQTPLTMEMRDGRTFMVIHEANLVHYARMFLAGPRMESRTLRAALAPLADGIKVRGQHAVRHAVANDPARRPRDRPRAVAAWPQPQSAERARRARTGSIR